MLRVLFNMKSELVISCVRVNPCRAEGLRRLCPGAAQACSYNRPDVIFDAVALGATGTEPQRRSLLAWARGLPERESAVPEYLTVTQFRVVKVFKGNVAATAHVMAPNRRIYLDTSCETPAMNFERGRRYLISGYYTEDGRIFTRWEFVHEGDRRRSALKGLREASKGYGRVDFDGDHPDPIEVGGDPAPEPPRLRQRPPRPEPGG